MFAAGGMASALPARVSGMDYSDSDLFRLQVKQDIACLQVVYGLSVIYLGALSRNIRAGKPDISEEQFKPFPANKQTNKL